jgi:hypothetical protein
MGIYRTYFDRNNTIIKDSTINTGRNQVSELSYGNQLTRFLFYCSFDEIKNKIANKEIIIDDNTKHYLHIKNTSNFDISSFLSNNNSLVYNGSYRSTSFDLELRAFKEYWDEGTGYDFILNTVKSEPNRDFVQEPSNWFYGTKVTPFLSPGGTLSPTVIATQHLDKGNEDILMDVSDFVNDILVNGIVTGVTTGTTTGTTTGVTTNYSGFCLKYTDDYESLTYDDTRSYFLGLFTKYTQTFFEPFIETVFDDHISDDRVDFYLDKVNNLFLYVNIGGAMTNLDALPACVINDVVYTTKQKTTGVYYAEIPATGTTFDSYTMYNDIWTGITVNNISLPDIKLSFIPKENTDYYQIGSTIMEPKNYGLSISGIKRDEKLGQGEKRKVFVHVRKPYTVEEHDVLNRVYYKLYIKQGQGKVTVLDWTKIDKIYNSNVFTVDTTWMIPQVYYIDIKIEVNGQTTVYNEELKFTINNTL